MSLNPQAVQIINVDLNNQLILNTEDLQKILLRDEIKNLNVVVVSIVGTYRQGKSFLLNFFLRFLNATCKEKQDVTEWLDSGDEHLSGFKWTASSKRQTVGIMMWSEVFISKLPSGEEVAVILLDTQGTFDNQTSIKDCATIFALSTLLSSVQIFNIKDIIKQNDLIYLKDFLDYGQLLSDETPDKAPFQNLLFLIRDWTYLDEHPLGEDGGQKYLDGVLDRSPDDPDDVTSLKQSVRKFFQKTSCFLLPNPGKKVVSEGTADLKEVDEDFKKFVQILVSKILGSHSLTVKEIAGKKVKVHELYRLIETYHQHFRSGKMPNLHSIYEATAEVQHFSALEESMKIYETLMAPLKDVESPSISDTDLFEQHQKSRIPAVEEFEKTKKMGGETIKQRFKLLLSKKIDEKFWQYVKDNQIKRKLEENQKEKERVSQKQKEYEDQVALLKVTLEEMSKKLEERAEERLQLEQRIRDAEKKREESEERAKELQKEGEVLKNALLSEGLKKLAEIGTQVIAMHMERGTQLEIARMKAEAKAQKKALETTKKPRII